MRTAYKVWSGIAAGVFCLVAIGDLSTNGTPSTTAATPAAVSAPAAPATYAPAVVAPAPVAPAQPDGDTVTVSDVIDGESFVADGQKVRVFGIDACEVSTYGGKQAKETAETFLEGQQVTLRAEPGVEKDKNGRLLRWVDLSSGDFGTLAVVYDHTGVDSASKASASYLDELRSADPNGRTCSAPASTTSSSSDDDDDVYVPLPRRGDNGLPDGALTGGFCAKKWWC